MENKLMSFEEWLENYYEENINSNSNNMNPEFEGARDAWFGELDVDELITYAEMWHKQQLKIMNKKHENK